jgi:hypothetical protein
MEPQNRKRHHYEQQQMEANGTVNGINHLPNAANGNNTNNNNNIEELGWKMAALEVPINIPIGPKSAKNLNQIHKCNKILLYI